MTCDQLGHLDHRRIPAVRGTKVPELPEALGPARAMAGPQRAQRFFERPGARGLQLHRLDRRETLPRTLRYILLAVEPQVLALDQLGIPLAERALVFTLSDLVYGLEHMAHDMETIKHHLVLGLRHPCLA